jgi:GntR family transcriptional regulator, rspAB operon transcriptional repressor
MANGAMIAKRYTMQKTTPQSAPTNGALSPVGASHGTLADVAYQQLLEAIIDGRLKPGDALGLDQVASQLGMSRTPVNLALSRLNAERLVSYRNHAGFFVRAVTPQELREIYDVRLMYERSAVEVGIGGAELAQLEALAAIQDEIERSTNWVEREAFLRFFRLDAQFHSRIVALASNELLSKLFGDLSYHVHGARFGLHAPQYDSFDLMTKEHRAILGALFARDSTAAQDSLRRHINRARDVAIQRLIAQQSATDTSGPAGGEPESPDA